MDFALKTYFSRSFLGDLKRNDMPKRLNWQALTTGYLNLIENDRNGFLRNNILKR